MDPSDTVASDVGQVPHERGSLASATGSGSRIKIICDDRELGVFAMDLVGAPERGDQAKNRRLALGDLQVVAQPCTEVSPDEIWTRCEVPCPRRPLARVGDLPHSEIQQGRVAHAHRRWRQLCFVDLVLIITTSFSIRSNHHVVPVDIHGTEVSRCGPSTRM